MRNPWIWSVSLGRWWNVHVRLHMFFFLFAVFAIYLTSSNANEARGVAFSIALLISVLLHEIGHVVIARRLGGVADEIVVGPLGGLSTVRVPYEPQSELVALMAGTMVNAVICFCSALALAILVPEITNLAGLLQPDVTFLDSGVTINVVSVLELVFWINWSLILVNLIPAFPFDGGRSLHALMAFLWPEADSRQALILVCRLGKVVSAGLLIVAWFYFAGRLHGGSPQPPVWLALCLLSIYIFFNSRREELQHADTERDDETVFGYDFSQGYTSLERSLSDDVDRAAATEAKRNPGVIAGWLAKRREARRERELAQEVEDERRVDEVLGRLHQQGMRSLSQDDRALLDRVSKRYRSRQSY